MISRPLSLLALVITPAFAGPLDPPVGPIAPTQKPLAEVEPRIAVNATNTPGDADSLFRITQPGSYYITGNITGVSGKHGIEIAAPGVTLDLHGFELVGVSGSLDGVSATIGNLRNLAVVNGTVRRWGGEGIDLGSSVSVGARVERIVASDNVSTGIFMGTAAAVRDCVSTVNGANGFGLGFNNIITNCIASTNGSNGIAAGNGCVITACASNDNAGNGIVTGEGGVVTDSSVFQNNQDGIVAGIGSTISGCVARLNRINGINISSDCVVRDNAGSGNFAASNAIILVNGSDNRIEGNNCSDSARGIQIIGTGNIVLRNTCSGNTINYAIGVGNRYGPIVDITAGGAAAVSGNAAPSTLASTDPNANFAY